MESDFEQDFDSTFKTMETVSLSFFEKLKSLFSLNFVIKIGITILSLAILFFVSQFFRKISKKFVEKKFSANVSLMLDRFIKYTFYILAAMYILDLLGINLSAVWGAAGVAGIALGFAAQTSISNVISGIFVIAEKSMQIGDIITIGDVTGIVDAIDLMSIKIHTFDNQYVRIPNSTVITSDLHNTSYHPKRRYCLRVPIAYETDLTFALQTLLKAPCLCPHAVKDPAPIVWFDSFAENRIEMTLALWCEKSNFITLKNEAFIATQKVFSDAGIQMPHNKLFSEFPSDIVSSKIEKS